MEPFSALVYDLETAAAQDEPDLLEQYADYPQLQWWHNWTDYEKMGISIITVWDYLTQRYYVFEYGEWHYFQEMAKNRQHIIGFYSKIFDDNVCKAMGIDINTTYDIYEEIRIANGLPVGKKTDTERRLGHNYKLENITMMNFGRGKGGINGRIAPILWQLNERATVRLYGFVDVDLAKTTFDHRGKTLYNPNTGAPFVLRDPI